jgi:hypothetical protein
MAALEGTVMSDLIRPRGRNLLRRLALERFEG